jgi:hypothetical protein
MLLSEEEKEELREMAASDTLREEYRIMRLNSQAVARHIDVDALTHWLTVMARVCAGTGKPRRPIVAGDMRL